MKKKVFIISLIIFILDQILKFLVNFYLMSEFDIIPGFFSLKLAYNNGAAFSIFSGNVTFLIIMNLLIFVFLFKYMKNFKKTFRNTLAFGLVFGGLFGNVIDRIRLGYVVDYLKFVFFGNTFPIFNLADTCLCIGMLLIIIAVIKKEDEYEINC
ncbi:MAG: signal peptidase II [bacterium]